MDAGNGLAAEEQFGLYESEGRQSEIQSSILRVSFYIIKYTSVIQG